jgi:hypothetical protein
MKCTQCGNKSFFQNEGFGFEVGGDGYLHIPKSSEIKRFICTNCGQVIWFDLWPVERLRELNAEMKEANLAVSHIEDEIKAYNTGIQQSLIQQALSKIQILDAMIKDENNTLKVVNEAIQKKDILTSELKRLNIEFSNKNYYFSIELAEKKKVVNRWQSELDEFYKRFQIV